MLDHLRRIRGLSRRRPVGEAERRSSGDEVIFDPSFSYSPDAGQEWRFDDDQVKLNGENVDTLIDVHKNDIGFLSAVSYEMGRYREHAWGLGAQTHEKFNQVMHGIQTKILGRLGHLFSWFASGVRYECAGDGRLWVNNIDVQAMINLYQLRPTPQARGYLMGLRDKLALILGAEGDSQTPHGVHAQAERIFAELSAALSSSPPDGPPLLSAHPG